MVDDGHRATPDAAPAPRSHRYGVRIGLALLALLAAYGVLVWESGRISPWDGDSIARDYVVVGALVWIISLTVRGWVRARRPHASAIGGVHGWWTATLVALSSGVLLGTMLYWLVALPAASSGTRWRAYLAAMRYDLRELAESQDAYRAGTGEFTSDLEALDYYSSDGVELELLSDGAVWTARTRHVAIGLSGFPDATCVVYGGSVPVDMVHRLPDGRIAPASNEVLCAPGAYDPDARDSR